MKAEAQFGRNLCAKSRSRVFPVIQQVRQWGRVNRTTTGNICLIERAIGRLQINLYRVRGLLANSWRTTTCWMMPNRWRWHSFRRRWYPEIWCHKGRCVLRFTMVGEKSTDKISHNTLTSCDHLPSMFYLRSIAHYPCHFQCIYLNLLYFIGIYTFQDRNNGSRAKKEGQLMMLWVWGAA